MISGENLSARNCAIAQAVSRLLPTAAAWVRSQVGFVVDKVALGQFFSEYFGFPCQFSFHRLLPNHHLSSGAGTISQIVADVPSGLSLTQRKKNISARNKPAPVPRSHHKSHTNYPAIEPGSPWREVDD
jgi:hypothetical protein